MYLKNKSTQNDNEKKIYSLKFSKVLIKDLYIDYCLDNIFCLFKSIYNILYLIYSNENLSIISYDLIDNKIINEIKNAHDAFITNFRHFLDKKNKIDLVISISAEINNIKLWNINNWICILNLEYINYRGYLFSSCFLKDKNKIYILTSNVFTTPESIKVYDFKGQKINEINESNELTYFIDTYYEINEKNKLSDIYIITGNNGFIKSFNYNENKIYHKYIDNENNKKSGRCSVIIYRDNFNKVKLIESSFDGHIRIWNFHSGLLFNKINIESVSLYGIELWNEEYLFIGCRDKKIRVLELKSGKIIIDLTDNNRILTVKIFEHPQYRECLISQGYEYGDIKLWILDN